MPRPPAHVTETELAVLEVLWDEDSATIRTITDRLYPDGTASHYATVQKLLERLEAKGLVRRSRRHVPHRFTAKIDRSGLVVSRLREVADTLCDGSIGTLLTTLVGEERLTSSDVTKLRELLDELDAGGSES